MRRPRITYVRCSRDEDYLKSLEAVGVSVHAVGAGGDIESALLGADGVVLAGGPDVDPALYGETMHPSCSLAEADARRVRDSRLPGAACATACRCSRFAAACRCSTSRPGAR